MAFDFGAVDDMGWMRNRLRSCFGVPGAIALRTPIGQLVKSSISGQTRDNVSLGAYLRLIETYPEWSMLDGATSTDIAAVIGDVTHAEAKAQHLRAALRIIAAHHPDFDLSFLGRLSVARALAWLERLPGVGRKVSASTLNFSTLRMPAFVVDTHVLRILHRFGLVRNAAETRAAYDVVMPALSDWSAADLAELHILMKHLGQTICGAKRAYCRRCPLGARCRTAALHLRSSGGRQGGLGAAAWHTPPDAASSPSAR